MVSRGDTLLVSGDEVEWVLDVKRPFSPENTYKKFVESHGELSPSDASENYGRWLVSAGYCEPKGRVELIGINEEGITRRSSFICGDGWNKTRIALSVLFFALFMVVVFSPAPLSVKPWVAVSLLLLCYSYLSQK